MELLLVSLSLLFKLFFFLHVFLEPDNVVIRVLACKLPIHVHFVHLGHVYLVVAELLLFFGMFYLVRFQNHSLFLPLLSSMNLRLIVIRPSFKVTKLYFIIGI